MVFFVVENEIKDRVEKKNNNNNMNLRDM